ncbi:MAG: cytochrome c [Chloroflexota bacterium]|nr:cytochrome c [Chloroflexota bacterium]
MEQSKLPPGTPRERAESGTPVPVAQGYVPEEPVEPGYETSDFSVPTIAWFTAGGVVLVILLLAAACAAFGLLADRAAQADRPLSALATGELAEPPPPRLQSAPQLDMAELRAREEALLGNYEVIDEEAGVARIPIDRAMELIAEQGRVVPGDAEDTAEEAEAEEEVVEAPDEAEEEEIIEAEEEELDPEDVEAGEALFEDLGCAGCHLPEGEGVGPSLVGIYGEREELEDGETVLVDEEYLIRSILQPNAQIVEGYPAVMPAYEGRVDDEELSQLVAYIKSLGTE